MSSQYASFIKPLLLVTCAALVPGCVGAQIAADATAGGPTGSSSGSTRTGSAGTGGDGPLEIIGQWMDDAGSSHEIDSGVWRREAATYHVQGFSNTQGFVLARNDAVNTTFPGLWSRFDWSTIDGQLRYCHTVADAQSELDAANVAPADATDPAFAGCSGLAWTRLDPCEGTEITGVYDDPVAGVHEIQPTLWVIDRGTAEVFIFESYSNIDQWVVAQNSAGNSEYTDKFSRFEWTTDAASELWYCQVVVDAWSEGDALIPPAADPLDPAGGGCGGSPWTKLTPQ